MKFGLNLYSIRTLIGNQKDFTATAEKLKEMGYSYMQYSGAPFNPEVIRSVKEQVGLPIVLTHVPMDRILSDTEKLMQEHASFGCYNIGLGMMPVKNVLDLELFKKTVEDLNSAGEIMAKNGFKFFYHHHNYEFIKLKGENITAFEYIVQNAPYINITADTYWVQFGGADVCKTLSKLKGKVGCVHLKDFATEYNSEKQEFLGKFAPVGDGNLDFKGIIQTLKECGTEYYLVEQDDAVNYPDCLAQVKRSIDYLTKEFN